jgi:hypothetical protein
MIFALACVRDVLRTFFPSPSLRTAAAARVPWWPVWTPEARRKKALLSRRRTRAPPMVIAPMSSVAPNTAGYIYSSGAGLLGLQCNEKSTEMSYIHVSSAGIPSRVYRVSSPTKMFDLVVVRLIIRKTGIIIHQAI